MFHEFQAEKLIIKILIENLPPQLFEKKRNCREVLF